MFPRELDFQEIRLAYPSVIDEVYEELQRQADDLNPAYLESIDTILWEKE